MSRPGGWLEDGGWKVQTCESGRPVGEQRRRHAAVKAESRADRSQSAHSTRNSRNGGGAKERRGGDVTRQKEGRGTGGSVEETRLLSRKLCLMSNSSVSSKRD